MTSNDSKLPSPQPAVVSTSVGGAQQAPIHYFSTKLGRRSALMSVREFTEHYPPCRTATYELLNSGQLVGVKVGSRTYITVESADAWAKGLPKYAPHRQIEDKGE
ncbi:MAG: helix-turn-helix domain-containing protein [Rhodospirillaceae bacterium]|nr:helix-turn-helix domain-containing protein [Rhodospirillaceae bacterium]